MRRSKPITTTEIVRIVGKVKSELLPALTARVAREKLAEVLAAGPVPYLQYVDGREGAPLESVKPGGMILFRFNRLGAVLDWIYSQLVQRSPIGKDSPPHLHYFQDHELYIDGEQINALVGEIIEVPPNGVATILDGRPYARKIEHGLSTQAPDGVYEITAVAAQRRFPYANITFSYSAFAPEAAGPARAASLRHAHRPSTHRAGYAYPMITVRTSR